MRASELARFSPLGRAELLEAGCWEIGGFGFGSGHHPLMLYCGV